MFSTSYRDGLDVNSVAVGMKRSRDHHEQQQEAESPRVRIKSEVQQQQLSSIQISGIHSDVTSCPSSPPFVSYQQMYLTQSEEQQQGRSEPKRSIQRRMAKVGPMIRFDETIFS